jgi:sterol desaturase/sphingolipid hydroxylase (fatty acid hydroxylase superfamily)
MHALSGFDRVSVPLLAIVLLALFAMESWAPLRARVEPRARRVARNAVFGALGSLIVRFGVLSAMIAAAQLATRERFGVLPWMQDALQDAGIPALPTYVLGFVLLDGVMYLWHRLNHEAPLLWRFHGVHHVDLDLDVTTALRFHPVELMLSIPVRVLQVLLIGPEPWLALAYELAMQVATAFHHANLRLPLAVDRALRWLIVTPRMHQIHHSVVPAETASNWSVVFSFWDRIARSYRCDVDQSRLVIGVPSCRTISEVTLLKQLALPFRVQPARMRAEQP